MFDHHDKENENKMDFYPAHQIENEFNQYPHQKIEYPEANYS